MYIYLKLFCSKDATLTRIVYLFSQWSTYICPSNHFSNDLERISSHPQDIIMPGVTVKNFSVSTAQFTHVSYMIFPDFEIVHMTLTWGQNMVYNISTKSGKNQSMVSEKSSWRIMSKYGQKDMVIPMYSLSDVIYADMDNRISIGKTYSSHDPLLTLS